MTFLTAELLVLLLASFLLGSGAAALAVRLLVRRTADQVSAYVVAQGDRR